MADQTHAGHAPISVPRAIPQRMLGISCLGRRTSSARSRTESGSTQPIAVVRGVMCVIEDVDDLDNLFRAEFVRLVRGLSVAYGVDAAADAVQEAFISAHCRWRTVARLDDPAGWVRRVALNQLMNGRRNRLRRSAILDSLRPVQPDHLTVEMLDLRTAISRLPEQMRLAVCLHHLSDLTIAQVAEALEVAPGTVKSNLHDARTKLRLALKDNSHV